jgi:hypothetical protein
VSFGSIRNYHQSDEIQLVPLVKEYFRLHGAVMKAVIGMHLPRLMELQRYGQVVLTKTGLPPGAVPVIWEGEDPQRPLHLCHFSFDEFAFVRASSGDFLRWWIRRSRNSCPEKRPLPPYQCDAADDSSVPPL